MKLDITCNNTTLAVFIECLHSGDLRCLDGSASEQELQQAWESLYGEYQRRCGGGQDYLLTLTRKVAALQAKIYAYDLLAAFPDEQVKYFNHAQMKAKKIRLRELLQELTELQKENADAAKNLLSDFNIWIVGVSKYMGYHIDRAKVMVSEFLAMNDLMEAELEQQKQMHSRYKTMR